MPSRLLHSCVLVNSVVVTNVSSLAEKFKVTAGGLRVGVGYG